ncbi:glycosyl transferase family 2 [Flavobacterium piscis]|uniref:Glycosyl transferase family 2 n=1 Tax=Flavobacterium piscis TaxID=1114874 RepID=A0ABX2XEK8_9FLAO|nr:glycosyltransferase family 2 protein [Flavobacterium piscis]OCB70605.1 glycosyl transferase family 2 [Flavobacterium piscis]OXG03731.1 glycosyl transferase family 2 [Flavobacterium piscis]
MSLPFRFSLIVCTYMRPEPLVALLESVQRQTLYPDEILIIDGSINTETELILEKNKIKKLKYFYVSDEERGLTKQRNFGIAKAALNSEIICFLDDDTVLRKNYFEELIKTYSDYPEALGVGGYITNETKWEKVNDNYIPSINEFYFDGWKRKDGSRFVVRKKLHLDSNCPPGFSPLFSHGRSVGFLPPSDKIYEVEQLMGGVSSFRKSVFEKLSFSTYFQGYGLYEDADFTLRVAKMGKLYINTNAKLAHNHAESGRPDLYYYGKMVVRNGWYVWRIKNQSPVFKDRIKWNLISILLTVIRFTNVFTVQNKKAAFTEASGRSIGLLSLLVAKPKIK